MTTLSFVLVYLATGAAIAVLAPIVGVGQIKTNCNGTDDKQLQFLRAVVATFFFVGAIVVTALVWPALIALAIYHQKEDGDK